MTHRPRITQRIATLGFQIMTMLLLGFMLVLLQPSTVQAQWATSGANINNTNTGNVGVGTSAPSEKLEVVGTVKSTGLTITGAPAEPNYVNGLFLGMNGTTATIDAVNQMVDFRDLAITSKTFRVNTWNGGSLATGLYQNTNAYVGIGTTSPTAPFTISTPGNTQDGSYYSTVTIRKTGDTFSGIRFDKNSTPLFRLGTDSTNNFQISRFTGTGAPDDGAFYINQNGNVGIGTGAPIYSLDVNGGLNGFRAKAASSLGSDTIATFENASGIQAIMRANGNVGIGTANPGYKLDLQGGALNSSGGLCIAGDCKTSWSLVSGWTTSGSTVYNNSANIGIGTNSPGAKLNVVGNTAAIAATFTVTPDGTNNYYAGNIHDGLLVDGSLSGTHGTYGSGYVRLFRIKALNGADSFIIGRGGEMTATPNTNYAGAALKLFPDASNSFYGGLDYDVLQIGGNQLNNHGTYTGKTVRLIHVTNAAGADAFVIGRDGNASFGGNLTVAGTLNAKYQDVAEWVESSQSLAAGTVVVLDETRSNQVIASTQAYDTRVAGVISPQPGITLGEKGERKVLVATTGRVKVKVVASGTPIRIGDLLVTSDTPGVAMRSEPITIGGRKIHSPGTLIGKALQPLDQGAGEILVLLSLQ